MVQQGIRVTPNSPTPSKWANAELMKVPNFLHLTPSTIKKHYDELRQFCTEFPKGIIEHYLCILQLRRIPKSHLLFALLVQKP